MDNSSFPKILEFKNKMPPDPQILRLKDWLSRYDFSVKHIKGKQNLIPDFLSRPEKTIQMITSTHSFPIIFMVKPSSKKAKTRQKPLSNKAKTCRFFPPGLTPTSHPDILEYEKSHYFYFIHETMKYKVTTPFMFNPNNLYGGEATLWAIWCKTVEYSIPIALRTKAAYDILMNPNKEDYLFWTLLEWFSPLNWWREELRRIINFEENRRIPYVNYPPLTSIIIFHRPYFQDPNGQIWWKNIAYFWGTFEDYPLDESNKVQLLQHLKEINSTGSSSSTVNPFPLNQFVPSSSNTQEAGLFKSTTEYYVPEEAQWVEYLSDLTDL
ncbi:hypothetical protein CR513_54360, partial [Mucuna pruriens]